MAWGSKPSPDSPNTSQSQSKSFFPLRRWGSKSPKNESDRSSTQAGPSTSTSTSTSASQSPASSTAPPKSVWDSKLGQYASSTVSITSSTAAKISAKVVGLTSTAAASSRDPPTTHHQKPLFADVLRKASGEPTKPPRTPTDSSYLSFNGVPFNGPRTETWMYARDARVQVINAPPELPKGMGGYPSRFLNRGNLPFQASGDITHLPIRPRTAKTWSYGQNPGSWRAFYNDKYRRIFDVGYHDPNKPLTGRGIHDFSLGTYHPRA